MNRKWIAVNNAEQSSKFGTIHPKLARKERGTGCSIKSIGPAEPSMSAKSFRITERSIILLTSRDAPCYSFPKFS